MSRLCVFVALAIYAAGACVQGGDTDQSPAASNPDATATAWVRTWGGEEGDGALAVDTDNSGNIYVSGGYRGRVDFDPGLQTQLRKAHEYEGSEMTKDVFVSKFDPDGSLLWVRTWGGEGDDETRAITVDSAGSVYVAGIFWHSVDFDPGLSIDMHRSHGFSDAFLAKFNSDGRFQWARTWGGVGERGGESSSCYGVGLDTAGDVYVTGYFEGTADFDPGEGEEVGVSNNGFPDAFLSKFDSDGHFQWVRTWGGGWRDDGLALAVDGAGGLYVTGYFNLSVDFDPGPAVEIRESGAGADAFVSRFSQNGDFEWVRTWGSVGNDNNDAGLSVTADALSNVYVAGYIMGTASLEGGNSGFAMSSNGETDAFVAEFSSDGTLQWARSWGGSAADAALAVAASDPSGVVTAGSFSEEVAFEPTVPGLDRLSAGNGDGFLALLDPTGDFLALRTWGGPDADVSKAVAVSPLGHVYVGGYFRGQSLYQLDDSVEQRTSQGEADCYLISFLDIHAD